jgi:hypothetical protein
MIEIRRRYYKAVRRGMAVPAKPRDAAAWRLYGRATQILDFRQRCGT